MAITSLMPCSAELAREIVLHAACRRQGTIGWLVGRRAGRRRFLPSPPAMHDGLHRLVSLSWLRPVHAPAANTARGRRPVRRSGKPLGRTVRRRSGIRSRCRAAGSPPCRGSSRPDLVALRCDRLVAASRSRSRAGSRSRRQPGRVVTRTTSVITAASIIRRSASGSQMRPKSDSTCRRRARKPSIWSVTPAARPRRCPAGPAGLPPSATWPWAPGEDAG